MTEKGGGEMDAKVCAGRDRKDVERRSRAALMTEIGQSEYTKAGMRSRGGLIVLLAAKYGRGWCLQGTRTGGQGKDHISRPALAMTAALEYKTFRLSRTLQINSLAL